MGNQFQPAPQQTEIVSNADNDYNPFNIPSLELNNANEFNGSIAIRGCPPFHKHTKSQFANYPIEIKAAYADGVIRGNYKKKWLQDQNEFFDPKMNVNDSSIGALAYVYLKTHDESMLDKLTEWETLNRNNNENFF